MASLHMQSSDHTARYMEHEGSLVSSPGNALLGGSSNTPKFGTLIPNRIFVGGIPSNTTEQELKTYFSSFGQVKDVKIINDRLGVAKGSYGFVTFENQEMAEQIIKNESETLIFKDRKLNIGHAIRKQQLFPRPADAPTTLFFAGGAIPCGFQNGMTVFPIAGQDYSMMTQPGSAYQSLMLQQANGAVYLSPQNSHAASQYSAALQSQLAQPNALTAFQQQQYQQAALGNSLSAVGPQGANHSTNAMIAAAMAAAVQWPNSVPTSTPQIGQQLTIANQNGNQSSIGINGLDTQPQVAALAAAVAAQQQMAAAAAWRWPNAQQQQQGVLTNQSISNSAPTASPVISSSSTQQPSITSVVTSNMVSPNAQQQSPVPASLGPSTYLYSPVTGTGHELMFIHQTNSPYTPNATSDYSTDHSVHSSSFLEAVEQPPGNFHCDISPSSRQPQSFTSATTYPAPFELACVAPYTTMMDGVATSSPTMVHSMLGISQASQHHGHQPGMLSMQTGQMAQQLITLANQQHKLFASIPQNTSGNQMGPPAIYGTPQSIILDVYPNGIPLAQVKHNTVMSENMLNSSVEKLTNQFGLQNHGICLTTQQNGVRGNSPIKSQPTNVNASLGMTTRGGIMDSINVSNISPSRVV